MKNLNEYHENGFTYPDYRSEIREQLERGAALANYIDLNITRMDRVEKTFDLNLDQKNALKALPKDFKVLIISEGWCGDAAQLLPIFNKMFEAMGIGPKIVLRDSNPELMDAYLTDGSKSIPIVIGFDSDGNELFHYGPRPKQGMDMLAKHRADPESFTKDEFYKELQQFYNADKGQSTVEELTSLMQEKLK